MRAELTALVLIAPLVIAATPCRSTNLTPEELDVRLAEVERIVADNEGNMDLWFGATYGVHAALVLGALTIANITDDDGTRDEMFVASVGSGLGLITLLIAQPPLIGAGQVAAGIPDKKTRLWELEKILETTHAKVNRTQSWFNHGLSFAYTLGASIFLWFALDRKRAAITQFLGGQLIGQGRLLLQPDGARDEWEIYRDKYLAGCGESAAVTEPAVEIEPAGLGLVLRF